MSQSLWVIRDRDSGNYWNGLGYSKELIAARQYTSIPPKNTLEWIPFAADVLELRLIERDSDAD